jgi:hypothetical protein
MEGDEVGGLKTQGSGVDELSDPYAGVPARWAEGVLTTNGRREHGWALFSRIIHEQTSILSYRMVLISERQIQDYRITPSRLQFVQFVVKIRCQQFAVQRYDIY